MGWGSKTSAEAWIRMHCHWHSMDSLFVTVKYLNSVSTTFYNRPQYISSPILLMTCFLLILALSPTSEMLSLIIYKVSYFMFPSLGTAPFYFYQVALIISKCFYYLLFYMSISPTFPPASLFCLISNCILNTSRISSGIE